MKIIARLDNGQLLLAVSKEFPEQMQLLEKQTRELADTVAFLSAITSTKDEQPVAKAPAETQAGKYAKAAGVPVGKTPVKVPVKAPAKVSVEQARKARDKAINNGIGKGCYKRTGTMADAIAGVMSSTPMHTRDIFEAYCKATGTDPADKYKYGNVQVALATMKKRFERTDKATYRLPAGVPVVAKPAAPVPVKTEVASTVIPHQDADPASLTDDQLKERMKTVAAAGKKDMGARIEFMRRNARGGK
jgi:hypothetical protein